MSLNISILAANAVGNSVADLINLGSLAPNGYIEIRTGAKPSSVQIAATGILLSTLQLANPAFQDFVNGQALANTIANDTDIADTGVAGWFRIHNRDGVPVIDGDVSITGGGGDIQFDNNNFLRGGTVAISSLLLKVA